MIDVSKSKPQDEWIEIALFKVENRLLKVKLQKQEMKIAFVKPKMEFRLLIQRKLCMVTRHLIRNEFMLYGRCASSYNILNTEILSAVIEFFNRTFEIGPNVRSMVHTDRGVAYCSMII